MNTTTIRINWDFVSRLFIGLLFIVAGFQKLTDFENFVKFVEMLTGFSGILASFIAITVIFIEIIIAGSFIFIKKYKDVMGYILIGFTVIATILAHNDLGNPIHLQSALKNLAIVGGLIATLNAVHKRRNIN